MIKNKLIIGFSLLAFATASCSDWLDVSSKSTTDSDELLITESGFKQVLNGVYTLLADVKLYGKATSMILPEALAQHWTKVSATAVADDDVLIAHLNEYDYTFSSVETYLETTWIAYYRAITQLNDILGNIDNPKISFSNNNREIIKGEALGLRAFLHLDILRFWGPLPSAGRSTIAIPYVREMTKEVSELISVSYEEVLLRMQKDLNAAEEILAVYDPIIAYTNDILNDPSQVGTTGPADDWHCFRQGRFNYYAVLGTRARLYQWISEKENAMKYAQKVIDAVNDDKEKKFQLANKSYTETYLYFCEHLFGVNNPNMLTNILPLFLDGTPPRLANLKASMDEVYSESTSSDIRYTANSVWGNQTYNGTTYSVCRKYMGADYLYLSSTFHNRTPLLRLAEMYLIMIEDLPYEELKSTTFLSDYINSRGLTASLIDFLLGSEAALDEQLPKEYRKEFFAEGQMFFFLKRKEIEETTWPSKKTIAKEAYQLPKPDAQIKFE